MLTAKCVQELGKIFKLYNFFCISPYEWDEKSARLEVTKSRWKYGFWQLQNFLYIVVTIYTTLSYLVRLHDDSFSGTSDSVMHLIWVVAYNVLLLSVLSNIFFIKEIQEFVNQIIKSDKALAGKTAAWTNEGKDKLGKMISLILPWCMENVLLLLLTYLFYMYNARFLARIFRPIGWPSYVIGFMLEVCIQLHNYYMIALYWIIFFAIFSSVMNHWVRVLRDRQRCSNLLQTRNRRWAVDLRSYRQLQVLNRLYNECLSTLAWPSFLLCNLLCHSLVIYISLKLSHEVTLAEAILYGTWALVWTVIAFVVYPHMGKTRELSEEYIRSLSNAASSKIDRAILKALRPLGVDVCHCFTMSRTTALNVIVIVSNLTINALLLL